MKAVKGMVVGPKGTLHHGLLPPRGPGRGGKSGGWQLGRAGVLGLRQARTCSRPASSFPLSLPSRPPSICCTFPSAASLPFLFYFKGAPPLTTTTSPDFTFLPALTLTRRPSPCPSSLPVSALLISAPFRLPILLLSPFVLPVHGPSSDSPLLLPPAFAFSNPLIFSLIHLPYSCSHAPGK